MADPRLVFALRSRAQRRKARKKLGPIKVAKFPKGQELQYRKQLLSYTKQLGKIIRESVFPLLSEEGDGFHAGELKRAIEKARAQIGALPQPDPQPLLAKIEAVNRGAMNVQYKRALGVEPFHAPGEIHLDSRLDAPVNVHQVIQTRLKENVRLIRSIPEELLADVESTIRDAFGKGLRVEVIRELVADRFGVAENRAQLIARDQVGKLNAQLTEARNKAVGVSRYVWQTSGDERVRGNPDGIWPKGMHYDLNGKTFAYDDPPVTNEAGDTNNPGEDYQCRCNALPIIEDALEALGI